MTDEVRKALEGRLLYRVWLISDLQQWLPEKAQRSLYTALEDFYELNLKCDKIWYLGDSVEGRSIPYLKEMTKMQEDAFVKLGIPLCYVCGNHDMDPLRDGNGAIFYEMVKSHPEWKTINTNEDFYFRDTLGDFDVVFVSDHYASDFSWWACHGRVYGAEEKYPYGTEDFAALRKSIAESGKRTITVSHYYYNGGNREGRFMRSFHPLQENVFMHIYGHAHIGDTAWAGKDANRKISWVDGCDVPQLDIASLERDRGSAVRSAFLEIYDGCAVVSFRDHDKKRWTESFAKSIY